MPSTLCARAPALLAAAALPILLADCRSSGAAGSASAAVKSVWPDGIPRERPAVVTLEHALTDPPRLLGLVSEDHPGIATNDAAFARSGMKRVLAADMQTLLGRLEGQGFLHDAAPVDKLTPLDPAFTLRRLSVCVDGVTFAILVPRHPDPELAKRFNELAHSVTEIFNALVDLRADPTIHDPQFFYSEQEHLKESNQSRARGGSTGSRG